MVLIMFGRALEEVDFGKVTLDGGMSQLSTDMRDTHFCKFLSDMSHITEVPLVFLLHGHVLFVMCFISKCNTILKVPYTSRNCLHRNY